MNNGIDTKTKTFTAEEMCSEIDKLIKRLNKNDHEAIIWYNTFKTLVRRWDKQKGNDK